MALSQIQLEAFQEIVRCGSFTNAAKSLGLTQSALSHRIRNLEQDLESTLFIRQGTKVRPTELGMRLLQFCRLQSKAEEEFLKELLPAKKKTSRLHGTLRIGAVSTLMRSVVLPAISPLVCDNRDIRVEICIGELADLPKLLASGQVDFLITTEMVNAPGVIEETLGHEEYVLIASSRKKTPEDTFLDHNMEDRTTYDFFKHNGKKAITLKRSFMGDIYGLLDGVAEGFGRAVAPVHLLAGRDDLKIVDGFKPLRLPVRFYRMRQPFYTKLQLAVVAELTRSVPKILAKKSRL